MAVYIELAPASRYRVHCAVGIKLAMTKQASRGSRAESLPALFVPADRGQGRDLWVFAYGSLMWNPGFAFAEARPARLFGYHRAFCIWSHRYRGTPRAPGLVLGLIGGGSCAGRVYRVPAARRAATIAKLFRREMITGVYRPMWHAARTPKGVVTALAFVANRDHKQYAGKLPEARVAAVLGCCKGSRGKGRDYLASTVRHLDALGIDDGPLHRLLDQVDARPRRRRK